MAAGCQRKEKPRSGSIVSIQIVSVTCSEFRMLSSPLTSGPGANCDVSDTPNHSLNWATSLSARHTRERVASRVMCFSMRWVELGVVLMLVMEVFTPILSCRWSGWRSATNSALGGLRCDRPPDSSLLLGAVFSDPAPICRVERASQGSGVKSFAVGRRSGSLPPGVIEITVVDRVEAEIVDKAEHHRSGGGRIAGDREGCPAGSSLRNAFREKAAGEDRVECLD